MSRKTLTTCGVAATLLLALGGTATTTAFAADGDATVVSTSVKDKVLTVTGTNLKDATLVLVGDTPIKINKKTPPAADGTSLTVPVPSSLKGGSYWVGVVTPKGIFAAGNLYGAVPVVSKVTEDKDTAAAAVKATTDLGGETVRLSGTGFTGLTEITVGKATAKLDVADSTFVAGEFKILSDKSVTLKLPKRDALDTFAAKSNSASVTILGENAVGGQGTKGVKVTYKGLPTVTTPTAEEAKLLTSVTTAKDKTGTLKGTNFVGAKVTVAGKAATVTVADATTLTFTVPAGTAGNADITVTTKEGKVEKAAVWIYTAPVTA